VLRSSFNGNSGDFETCARAMAEREYAEDMQEASLRPNVVDASHAITDDDFLELECFEDVLLPVSLEEVTRRWLFVLGMGHDHHGPALEAAMGDLDEDRELMARLAVQTPARFAAWLAQSVGDEYWGGLDSWRLSSALGLTWQVQAAARIAHLQQWPS
jgi:hypothetical protein